MLTLWVSLMLSYQFLKCIKISLKLILFVYLIVNSFLIIGLKLFLSNLNFQFISILSFYIIYNFSFYNFLSVKSLKNIKMLNFLTIRSIIKLFIVKSAMFCSMYSHLTVLFFSMDVTFLNLITFDLLRAAYLYEVKKDSKCRKNLKNFMIFQSCFWHFWNFLF